MDSAPPYPPFKRRRITKDESISPPPLRRKKPQDSGLALPKSLDTRSRGEIKALQIGDPNRFEIISWNVNGIYHLLPPTTRPITHFFDRKKVTTRGHSNEESETECVEKHESPLREFIRRHKFPKIICLQEVKIPRRDERLMKAVERAANLISSEDEDDEPYRYEATFSLPRDKYNATGWGGKVYGVCTLIRIDILNLPAETSVITKAASWDTEGRVLITEMPLWKLVVVNGYWPNGTTNPWKSSKNGTIIGTRHDAKRAFHSKMLLDVKSYESQGWNVVLVGDMNVARTPLDGHPGIRTSVEHVNNRKDFNEKFFDGEEGMEGVDTWRWVHGDKRGFTYHGEKEEEWGKSCDRVDLGIVSRRLVERGALIGADIWESVGERGGSDHVPLSVVLDSGSWV